MILEFKNTIFKVIFLLTLPFFIISCSSDDDGPSFDANLVIQSTETNIEATLTTLKVKGNIMSDNGLISKGICWNKNPKPTTNNDKVLVNNTNFTPTIGGLSPNTTYYFRIFSTTNYGTTYSQEKSFTTLTLADTHWQFTIIDHNSTQISAKVNFYADGTTKYVEDNCPSCYVPYGAWSFNGNNLSFIGENSNPVTSTHVFYGNAAVMTLQGTYQNLTNPNGTWSAVKIP